MKRTFVKLFVSFLVGLLPINVLAAPSAPTLQKCELYFPHIASSSIWETEIGIINTGSTLLQGSLFAYSGAGTVVESRGVSISPNGKTSLLAGDDFQNSSDITYMKLEAENATCTGYEKFYREGHRAAVPAVSRVNTGNIYVSHIASGANWWTGLALVNTNPTPKNITITFSDGSQHELNLGAGAHWAGTIKGSFTDVNAEEVESAVISNARGVIGLELFGSTASINKQYLSGVLLTDETARALYYPHVASSQKWWTGIVSYNPADTSNIMTITPYTSLGSSLPTSTITIGAGGKYIGTAKALNLPEGTAWFKVEGTLPMSGFELFGTNDGKQLAGYTAVNVSSKEGVFAKLEHEGWTGIAFVNIDPSPVAVTLSAIDSSGSLVASKELSVAGNGKKVNVAQAFFADDISSADYIKFSSDRNIVGFQLNGSSDNLLLDGLEIFVETTELLLPPQLSYTIDGTYLSLSWPTVSNATGYTLSYTQPPYTGPQNFHLIDLGNQTGISYRLWDGASFYIAVQSYNDYGTSDYSNIEYFIIDNIDHGGTCHYADTDCNDCIEYTELMAYIDLWKTGEVAMSDLMEAIGLWKQGCDGATEPPATITFATSDLEGSWISRGIQLPRDGEPDAFGYDIFNFTFQSDGTFSGTGESVDGDSWPESGFASVSPEGVVKYTFLEGELEVDPDWFSQMGVSKDIIVSNCPGGCTEVRSMDFSLDVFVKKGNSYSLDDLTGTWVMRNIYTGHNNKADNFGYEVCTVTFLSNGSYSGSCTDASGSDWSSSGTGSIANDGSVTLIMDDPELPGESNSWDMGISKNVMIHNYVDNSVNGETYSFNVWVKQGSSYSLDDLAGTWVMHAMHTGHNNKADNFGYDVCTIEILPFGNYLGDCSDLSGFTWQPSGTVSVANDGSVNFIMDDPEPPGASTEFNMGASKNVMIHNYINNLENNEEYALGIWVKKSNQ